MTPERIGKIIRRIVYLFRKHPAHRALIALYLSIRWQCLVSPRARVYFPGNLRIGRGARIGEARIWAHGPISIGARVSLGDGAILDSQYPAGSIVIGESTAIGPYSIVYGFGGVRIGRQCLIAGHVMIVGSSHVFERRDIPICQQGSTGQGIIIGDDVWIGAQCVLIDGSSVGTGAIIGAGSVVRYKINDYDVAAGAPAQILHSRPGVMPSRTR